MAPRFVRKLALLEKAETVYGTDSVPTGAANALLATNVVLTPIVAGRETRDLLLPYMGHQGVILSGEHVMIEYSIEIAGAGAAGSVPGYGISLRTCGFAETITAATDVTYELVSGGFESSSMYYNLDGVRHVLLGSRGTLTSIELTAQRIPRMRFRKLGLLGTITDVALPAVTTTAFQKPVIVSKANTSFSLHGYSGPMEALTLNLGGQVEPRLLVNHESIEIVDRQMTGSVTIEAASMATKDWFAIARARTRGVLAAQQGTVAGNIVQFASPAVEIEPPEQGASQGIANNRLGLIMCPTDAGNDEFSITVK